MLRKHILKYETEFILEFALLKNKWVIWYTNATIIAFFKARQYIKIYFGYSRHIIVDILQKGSTARS